MNTTIGLTPTEITGFNGLYSRGSADTCPADHLTDCYNCIFPGKSQVGIREPLTIQSTIPGRSIISFFIASVAAGSALLTLNADNTFYDETHNVLLGNFAADDFEAVNIFGRTYVTFKSAGKALPGGNTYCYYYDADDAAYIFAPLITTVPGAISTLAQANAGVVDVGVHQIAVSYLNDRGFLSPPTPILFTSKITSLGGKDIEINSPGLPIGPPETVARVLLMTLANQLELFFVPGGTINDNTTTLAVINVPDSSLISSADSLNNLMLSIPSCASFIFYHGRLVLVGQDQFPDDILISNVGNPESFDSVTGVVHMPVEYGVNTSNGAMVIRDTLYITKPNGTYSVQDNGLTPDTWPVTIIDSGIGAWADGISVYHSSMSGQDVLDSCLIVNKRGLMIFDGNYQQVPLSWKIETVWQALDPITFYRIQITHDVDFKRVYICVPNTSFININPFVASVILMMDYTEGLGPTTVKWSVWYTATLSTINKISVENFTLGAYGVPTPIYQLAICGGTDTIYKIVAFPGFRPDSNVVAGAEQFASINQMITSAPDAAASGIRTFQMLEFSIQGYGSLVIKIYNIDRTVITTLKSFQINLTTYHGQNLQRLLNITDDRILISLQADQSIPIGHQGSFLLTRIGVYAKKMWNMRPVAAQSS